jgi:hypothetical protein
MKRCPLVFLMYTKETGDRGYLDFGMDHVWSENGKDRI